MDKCTTCGVSLKTVRPGVQQCENEWCRAYGRGVYANPMDAAEADRKRQQALEYHKRL